MILNCFTRTGRGGRDESKQLKEYHPLGGASEVDVLNAVDYMLGNTVRTFPSFDSVYTVEYDM